MEIQKGKKRKKEEGTQSPPPRRGANAVQNGSAVRFYRKMAREEGGRREGFKIWPKYQDSDAKYTCGRHLGHAGAWQSVSLFPKFYGDKGDEGSAIRRALRGVPEETKQTGKATPQEKPDRITPLRQPKGERQAKYHRQPPCSQIGHQYGQKERRISIGAHNAQHKNLQNSL